MNIIGIYGKKQTGKDSVAKIIQVLTSEKYFKELDEHVFKGSRDKEIVLDMDWDGFMNGHLDTPEGVFYHLFQSYEVKRFAGALKQTIAAITGVSYTDLLDEDFKNTTDPYLELTYRQLHQDIGQTLRENINIDIWFDSLFRHLKDGDRWIIADLRHINEYDGLIDYNSLIVKVQGPEEDLKDDHISETSLDDLEDHQFDFIIDNSDRSQGFKPLVSQVYDFLYENELIPE